MAKDTPQFEVGLANMACNLNRGQPILTEFRRLTGAVLDSAEHEFKELQTRRDELLAALKAARHYMFLPVVTHPIFDKVRADIDYIDAAIAKAEGD